MKNKNKLNKIEQSFKDKYEVEFEHTVKSFKSINRKDLPIYTKKYDGDWLYRLRLHNGFIKCDRIIISPYYELSESKISHVLGIDNINSDQNEWRLAMHNLIKYYQENE
tara:strand:- start:409 stop:735 length:327 start_codon:yes stop_codon:yes gene_type:complete